MTWLPLLAIIPDHSPDLTDDDFTGHTLVVQWGRFIVEIMVGRRDDATASHPFPTSQQGDNHG